MEESIKMKKISNLDDLQKIIKKFKKKGKKIVQCHGVFDLLHLGHIKHFEKAKNFGDILIVTVTPDEYVKKGPNRPVFSLRQRMESLSALEVVDYVAPNKWDNAEKAIKIVKPNVYCKGPDYKDNKSDLTRKIYLEIKAVKSVGGRIEYTDKKDIFSSSKIINESVSNFSTSQKNLIYKIKKKFSFEKIQKIIESFNKLKILVIGETIIDQYFFCEAMGKSGKEPVLVLRDLKMETYPGGSAAIARHLSPFCKSISLLSMLGEKKEFEGYLKKTLPKNIKFDFIYKSGSPTILKKRFVEQINKRKILGVYNLNDQLLSKKNEEEFSKKLDKHLKKYDLIILTDYGHGLISQKSANKICNSKKFLSVCAQVNSSNIGYHTISKYKNSQSVVINETELRHEMRDKNQPIKLLMSSLCKKYKIKNLIVTRGSQGVILFSTKDKKYYEAPAFTDRVTDKVGTGDAMMAIISLCLKMNFDKNLTLLISSLAAAQSVETIGNKNSIEKNLIYKSLQYLLK